MKRLFSFMLAVVCMLVFTGCGKKNSAGSVSRTTDIVTQTQISEITKTAETTEVNETVTEKTEAQTEEPETDEVTDTVTQQASETETEKVPETVTELVTEPVTEKVTEDGTEQYSGNDPPSIDINGSYTSKDDVALYIHTYGKLPENFITKKEAEALGWSGGSLEPYASGKCIGGSRFGNYEGVLPSKKGRKYTECDIDTLGAKSRGAKRIVFSDDGLIYYTEDHYSTFELLYGNED